MDNKYISTTFSNFEKVNDEFLKCTISVMSCDQIANGMKFTKDSVLEAMGGLNYAPLIGYFKEGDFSGHGKELVLSDNGIEERVMTIPFGVVIKDSQRFEQISKDNGETEEYLVVDAYMWNRYNEACAKVKENECNQSMEISCNSYDFKDDYIEVTSFNFSALCILGSNIEPAFEISKIRTYDNFEKVELKSEYSEMIAALDKFLFSDNKDEKSEEFKDEIPEEKEEEPKDEEIEDEKEVDSAKKKKCSNETEDEEIDYQEKFNSVSSELEELKKSFVLLENERNELLEFKQNIEKIELSNKQNELLDKFSMLEGFEGFSELKDNINNYSLEELENQLFALLGKKNFSANMKKQTKKPNETVKVSVFEKQPEELSEAERRYGTDIVKYIKK